MQNNELKARTADEQRTAADNSTSASVEASPMLSAALSVEEGNKLIAEFLGYTYYDAGITPCVVDFLKNAIPINGLKYHTSWDWLMPVVEKIENYGFNTEVILKRRSCNIIPRTRDFVMPDCVFDKKIKTKSKIENTWACIIEFINWYNDNIASVGSR
jgi:hypothetical protein